MKQKRQEQKDKAKQRGRDIKAEQQEKLKRQREKDAAQMDWHKSGKEKNDEVKLLAYTERTDKVSDIKGELTVALIEVWKDGETVCGWDLDEFTDIVDGMQCNDVGFDTMCNMSKAVKKSTERKTWAVCKVYIRKIKKKLDEKNKDSNNDQ